MAARLIPRAPDVSPSLPRRHPHVSLHPAVRRPRCASFTAFFCLTRLSPHVRAIDHPIAAAAGLPSMIDLGGRRAGQASGTMSRAGNAGSAITGPAFPARPAWTRGPGVCFYLVAGCSILAACCWLLADPTTTIEEIPA